MQPTAPLLLYDHLHVRGGAEHFSLELLERWPGSRLLVAARDPSLFDAVDRAAVEWIDPRPLATTPARRAWRAIQAFRRVRAGVAASPGVLASGHFAPLALGNAPAQRRLYFAHTLPLPFLHGQERARLAGAGPLHAGAIALLGTWLRPRYAAALRSTQRVLANSRFTANAYARWPGVEAEVLPPPCAVEQYQWRPSTGHFLSFARQEPQKRVDRVIEAFRRCPQQRLIVASDGSEHDRLRGLAAGAGNIEFVRDTSPGGIRALLETAVATVHIPADEPFGLSAVESLAAGKPVVACDEGGLGEIVEPGRTGWLLRSNPESTDLAEQIRDLGSGQCEAMKEACQRAAARYSWTAFLERLQAEFVV